LQKQKVIFLSVGDCRRGAMRSSSNRTAFRLLDVAAEIEVTAVPFFLEFVVSTA
jgi:hypothetical protein